MGKDKGDMLFPEGQELIPEQQELVVLQAGVREAVGIFVDLEEEIRRNRSAKGDSVLPIQDATRNNCKRISALVGVFAQMSGYFDEVFLVEGERSGQNQFKKANWYEHAYLVARGLSGRFYATSPANYEFAQDTPFDVILTHNSLDDTLNAIATTEGGSWPSAHEVTEAIGDLPRQSNPDTAQVTYIQRARYSGAEHKFIAFGFTPEQWAMAELLKRVNHG